VPNLLNVPASYFGIVLGLAGLGGCWRVATRLWVLPAVIGETIIWTAVAVWAALSLMYLGKWMFRFGEAFAEFEHPVQCCFVGLMPVSTMLVGIVLIHSSPFVGALIGSIGALGQIVFAVYRTGVLWTGGRDQTTTTPILYLPTVAGNLVTSNLASALHLPDVAAMFFGAGVLAWLALESVLMHRLYTQPPLPVALRPTLGIQLAPPVVACSAYLALTAGEPDLIAKGLLGYGLIQALILARMLPWIVQQSFSPSYWAFTFGLTALAFDAMRFAERSTSTLFAGLAEVLFLLVNTLLGAIILLTLKLLVQGRLFTAAATVPVSVPAMATKVL
jgi:tellurite resistance protein